MPREADAQVLDLQQRRLVAGQDETVRPGRLPLPQQLQPTAQGDRGGRRGDRGHGVLGSDGGLTGVGGVQSRRHLLGGCPLAERGLRGGYGGGDCEECHAAVHVGEDVGRVV